MHEGLEISNEFEFDDANESEVNEPPNATLRDFDNYPMDDAGHVVSNNVKNVVYNNQPYFEKTRVCVGSVYFAEIEIFLLKVQ